MDDKISIGNRLVTEHYLRRALAILKIADQMPRGAKYEDMAELLSAFGFSAGVDTIKNYATDARRYLSTK